MILFVLIITLLLQRTFSEALMSKCIQRKLDILGPLLNAPFVILVEQAPFSNLSCSP